MTLGLQLLVNAYMCILLQFLKCAVYVCDLLKVCTELKHPPTMHCYYVTVFSLHLLLVVVSFTAQK